MASFCVLFRTKSKFANLLASPHGRFFRQAGTPRVASWALAAVAVASFTGVAPRALAQSGSLQQLPTPSPPVTKGGDTQSRTADAAQATANQSPEFKEINKLVLKGWATAVPTFADTVDQNYADWRLKLAHAGFGVTVWSLNLGVYDFAEAGKDIGGAQLYNGQKFTYQTGNQTLVLTYDLSHIGLKDGQIATIVAGSANSYQTRDGIRSARIKGFSWYQPVGHGKVEFELGIIANQTDYLGTSVGGSLAGGALGPQASLPVEAGLSYGQYGAPTVSARVNYTKHLYSRTGLQRSISPQGSTAEFDNNTSGFAFTVPNAKPLVMQEFGYRVVSTPNVKSFWFRTGGLYNNSQYTQLRDKITQTNHFVYAAVDRQVTQPSATRPARGIYVGATYDAGPGAVDLISRYYEARTYVRGIAASRPDDMFSIVAAINGYGVDGRKANTVGAFTPFSTTQSYTGSYSFHITHGFYVQPGLSVVNHPVYNRNIGTAVNGLINLVGFF